MKIDGIENGIVLDHIKAGKSMLVYKYLGLDSVKSPVALIQNCHSQISGTGQCKEPGGFDSKLPFSENGTEGHCKDCGKH